MDRKPLHLCLCVRRGHTSVVDNDALSTLQALVTFGGTWDREADELIREGQARAEAPALRTCVLLWTRQRERGRPLSQVEFEVVHRGQKAVETFFDELEKSSAIYHRRKICVVGPSNAGKTSFVKSVVTKRSSLEHPDNRTIGVDQFKLRFDVEGEDKDVVHEVTFWDFAGQDEYQIAHSLFYSRRTLYLVCVDLGAYLLAYIQADLTNDTKVQRERMMNEFIERSVLKWVRTIFARQPNAEFVFVATKEDLLIYPKFTKELKAFLAVKLAEVEGIVREQQREVAEQTSAVEAQVQDERKADTLTLHAYKKRLEERNVRGQEASASTLSQPSAEMVMDITVARAVKKPKRLRLKLAWKRTCERVVSAVSARPNLVEGSQPAPPLDHTAVPISATRGRFAGAALTKSRPTLFISCSDVNLVAKARHEIKLLIHGSERSFQMPESYSSVLNAVVATREAVAKGDPSARITIVFASRDAALESLSSQLGINKDTIRLVLQILHDLGDVLWYEDLGVPMFERTVILDPMLLIDFVRQVITHAHKVDVLSHSELARLPFWIDLHDENQILAMKQMLQKFQLVHPTQGEMKWDSDLIVPAFWKAKTPASWLFKYSDLRLAAAVRANDPRRPPETVRVHWEYQFPHEFPDALFDHLVVASYSPFKVRTAGPDWIMYTEDCLFACRVMVSRDVGTKQRMLQLEAVLAEAADETQATMLWESFEILGEAIVEVLRRYPGIVFTSTALDTDGKASRLEDLFSFRPTTETKRWMPRKSTWEMYKKCVLEASAA